MLVAAEWATVTRQLDRNGDAKVSLEEAHAQVSDALSVTVG